MAEVSPGGAVPLPQMPVGHDAAMAFCRLVFPRIARLHMQGLAQVPQDEPLLVCPNHLSYLDPPFVSMYLPPMSVMVANTYQSWANPLGWIVRLSDAIFVRRGEVDRQAIKEALRRLRGGRSIGVAPEGTRSRTGGLQPGRDGVIYLAQKTGVRVQPVALWGTEQILPALRQGRRADVYVVYGEAYHPTFDPSLPRQAQLDMATNELMLRIARLLPPAYRGVYAALVDEAGG